LDAEDIEEYKKHTVDDDSMRDVYVNWTEYLRRRWFLRMVPILWAYSRRQIRLPCRPSGNQMCSRFSLHIVNVRCIRSEPLVWSRRRIGVPKLPRWSLQ
jgi:hypothetical protein